MAYVADRNRGAPRPRSGRTAGAACARGGAGRRRRPPRGAGGRGGDGGAVTYGVPVVDGDPVSRRQPFTSGAARVAFVAPRGAGARHGARTEEGNPL
ncbi:hypothetical protein GCM10010335_23020 [Streptomyces galbus]|nr:hypothetical protein GCM10010335_23020 [Streptomyces galbus]